MNDVVARMLIADEISDLTLYQRLRAFASVDTEGILDEFVQTETRHVAFWRAFFRYDAPVALPRLRRAKLAALVAAARIGGASVTLLILEAIEVHGVKKYLDLWNTTPDAELKTGLRTILEEELVHEDEAFASSAKRRVNPDAVRNAFLGFNDGSVEILGAVNGLAAAFGSTAMVAAAGLTVSVAGALSMAAGAYLSTDSERELLQTDAEKRAFLGSADGEARRVSPVRSAALVGCAYLLGAAMPVLPFVLGARHAWWSIALSGALILTVSSLLSFISGMNLRRRVLLNFGILTVCLFVSYAIGLLVGAGQ